MAITDDTDHGGSEDGENYFVSMTDMMVGVLFIFIIMLMMFALDFRTKTEVQENAVDEAHKIARKLEELRGQVRSEITMLDEAQRVRREMLRDIESQLQAEGLNVRVDEASGVLRLAEDSVRFNPNEPELKGIALTNVSKIARVLERVLPRYSACRLQSNASPCRAIGEPSVETVFIEGHTDSDGTDPQNWLLSVQRAVNTYRHIVGEARALRMLRNQRGEEIISVSGYAATRPIDAGNSRDAWARNRRIDLRFVMEVDRQRLGEILKLTGEMEREIAPLLQASGSGR